MQYTLNTGPYDIRPTGVGDFEQLKAQCVDVYVEPPFSPGEGLKKALGVSDDTVFEHVSTTDTSTHMYVEVPYGKTSNASRISQILDRLEWYLNPIDSRVDQETVDKFRENII